MSLSSPPARRRRTWWLSLRKPVAPANRVRTRNLCRGSGTTPMGSLEESLLRFVGRGVAQRAGLEDQRGGSGGGGIFTPVRAANDA